MIINEKQSFTGKKSVKNDDDVKQLGFNQGQITNHLQASHFIEELSYEQLNQEKQFWNDQHSKYKYMLSQLQNLGLPYIKFDTSIIPEKVQQLVKEINKIQKANEQEDYNDVEKQARIQKQLVQLISVVIEGHPKCSLFSIALSVQQFLNGLLEHPMVLEHLMILIADVSDIIDVKVKNVGSQIFDVQSFFKMINSSYDKSLFVGTELKSGSLAYQIKDLSSLAPWISMKKIQNVRRLRSFIVKFNCHLVEFVKLIEQSNNDFEQYQKMFLKIDVFTKEWNFKPFRSSTKKKIESRVPDKNSNHSNANNSFQDISVSDNVVSWELDDEQKLKKQTQRSLKKFFSTSTSRIKESSQDQRNCLDEINEVLRSMGCISLPQLQWNKERQMEFELVLQGQSQFSKSDFDFQGNKYGRVVGNITGGKIVKKKYISIYDSVKELKGFVLTLKSSHIKGRCPFIIDRQVIDYDQDSEDEIQEYQAEGCETVGNDSFSEESETPQLEDLKFVISDQILNTAQLKEYDQTMNFNQQQQQQISMGDYNPFQFIIKELSQPEHFQFFDKYNIISIEDVGFPLQVDKWKQMNNTKIDLNFLQNDENLIKLLLFAHGQRQSRSKIIKEFIKINLECRYTCAKSSLDCMSRGGEQGRTIIKSQFLKVYNIEDRAQQIFNDIIANETENESFQSTIQLPLTLQQQPIENVLNNETQANQQNAADFDKQTNIKVRNPKIQSKKQRKTPQLQKFSEI